MTSAPVAQPGRAAVLERLGTDPAAQHLGIRIESITDDQVVVAVDAQGWMLNGHGILHGAVLFWLGDDSPDHAETRAFIDRRIEGVMRFEAAKSALRKLPGAERLGQMAFGWIRAPQSRDLPGHSRP